MSNGACARLHVIIHHDGWMNAWMNEWMSEMTWSPVQWHEWMKERKKKERKKERKTYKTKKKKHRLTECMNEWKNEIMIMVNDDEWCLMDIECLVSMSPTFAWCLGAVLLWSFVFMLELFMSRMFPLAHFFCHSSGSSGSSLCVLCCADLLAPSPFPRPSIISAMVAGVVPVVLGMLLLFEKRGREVANTYLEIMRFLLRLNGSFLFQPLKLNALKMASFPILPFQLSSSSWQVDKLFFFLGGGGVWNWLYEFHQQKMGFVFVLSELFANLGNPWKMWHN